MQEKEEAERQAAEEDAAQKAAAEEAAKKVAADAKRTKCAPHQPVQLSSCAPFCHPAPYS